MDDEPQFEADEDLGLDEGISPRHASEAAARAVVLIAVIGAANGANRSQMMAWLTNERLWDQTSPQERTFLRGEKADRETTLSVLWRTEALQAIVWALGKLADLPPANRPADPERIVAVVPAPGQPTGDFIASAALRDFDTLLEADRANYELGNVVDEAVSQGRPAPDGMSLDVLYERRCAFEWLLDGELVWDEAGEVGEADGQEQSSPDPSTTGESDPPSDSLPNGWHDSDPDPDSDDRDPPLPPTGNS